MTNWKQNHKKEESCIRFDCLKKLNYFYSKPESFCTAPHQTPSICLNRSEFKLWSKQMFLKKKSKKFLLTMLTMFSFTFTTMTTKKLNKTTTRYSEKQD